MDAVLPMLVRVSGSVREASLLQFWNTESLIVSTPDGTTTVTTSDFGDNILTTVFPTISSSVVIV